MMINLTKLSLPRHTFRGLVCGQSKLNFVSSTYFNASQNINSEPLELNSKQQRIEKNINPFGIPLVNRSLERDLFGEVSANKSDGRKQFVEKGKKKDLESAHSHLKSFNINIHQDSALEGMIVFHMLIRMFSVYVV